jgi:hypothetical protein
LLANQALERSKTRDELLKQTIDVVFLLKSDQMVGADKTFESRSPFTRRLDDPKDYVRIEIAQALQRGIPVIPILLDSATIPKADQLPEDLKELASRNGMHIHHASFHDDMNRLIRELKTGGLAISGKVFISYRRSDSAAYAGRVWDRLERDVGRDSLFMDVAAIPLGTNFPEVLHEEVAKCGILLAMIGPNWLDARDEQKGQLDQAVSSDEQTTADARQSDLAVALGTHSLKVLRGQPIRHHDLQSARRVWFQTKLEPPMGGKNSLNISGRSEPLARNL